MDEKGRLTDALLKTKVLLHRIGKKELAEWVNLELNGYSDNVEVPTYRVLSSRLMGSFSNIAWRYTQHPLPTSHLKPDIRKQYQNATLRDSLSVLEDFGQKGTLMREIPPEAYRMLDKGLDSSFVIDRAWCETPAHDVRGILTQVRSRLLDFLLELKDGIGDVATEDDMKQKADEIDTAAIFQHAVIGDNATFVFGSHNIFSVKGKVNKGDFESLAQMLTKSGIPSDEVEALKGALDEDRADGKSGVSEGQTGGWFLRLLGKAGRGAIAVGADIVSKVVTDGLTAYFGNS
jgi:hypothetical protein